VIAFCGYANSDLTVSLPVLPTAGDRVQATALHRRDGGMAANAAVAAARMDADARFAGVVGPDRMSTAFLDALAADGVDVTWAARTGELTTAVIMVTPDGERSIISQDDTVTTEHVAAVARQLDAAGGGLLYLDGYRFPDAAEVLAATAGSSVVDLDGCEQTQDALGALRNADHVIIGSAQAARLFGDTDPAELAIVHAVHLVVTSGARGWWLHTPGGERHHEPAVTVAVVDATGAGDCFTGTYCAELDRGATPVEAARFAGVAASLSCMHPGARAGSPTRAAVLRHLETIPSTPPVEETTCAE